MARKPGVMDKYKSSSRRSCHPSDFTGQTLQWSLKKDPALRWTSAVTSFPGWWGFFRLRAPQLDTVSFFLTVLMCDVCHILSYFAGALTSPMSPLTSSIMIASVHACSMDNCQFEMELLARTVWCQDWTAFSWLSLWTTYRFIASEPLGGDF